MGDLPHGLSKPPRPKGGSPSKPDTAGKPDQSRHVWGELVKANHSGAPINKRRLFERDAASGRLTDVTAAFFKEVMTKSDLLNAFILAIGKASDDGRPFTKTGDEGLYDRRKEFPECLANHSKRQLWAMADAAVKDNWVVKLADGRLLPADAAQDEGDRHLPDEA